MPAVTTETMPEDACQYFYECTGCGARLIERDWYGSFSTCICCGYVREAVSSPAIDLMLEDEEGHGRQRRRQPSHGKLRL